MWCVTCRNGVRGGRRMYLVASAQMMCGALQLAVRGMYTPLGGIVDPLPPSFGHSQAKGEISHMNLRRKRQQRLLREKRRKKLLLPTTTASSSSSSSSSGVSLARVKRELQQLIRSNAIYSGRRNEDASLNITVYNSSDHAAGEAESKEGVHRAADSVPSHLQSRAMDRRRIAQALGDEDAADENQARRHMRRSHVDMGAGPRAYASRERGAASPTLAQHLCTNVKEDIEKKEEEEGNTAEGSAEEGEEEVSSAATPQSKVTALTRVHDEGEGGSQTHSAEEEEDMTTWAAQQSLEYHFAVRPGSTVFGSDLDRLEQDMMRDYDQHHRPTRPLEAAFTQYGAGRRGRRLAWLPSSSLDRIEDAGSHGGAVVNVARITDKVIRHDTHFATPATAAYHVSAEAYRQVHPVGAGCCIAGMREADDKDTTFSQQTGEDGAVEELPAEANPHFPCEADGQAAQRGEGDEAEDVTEMIAATASQWLARGRNADRVIKLDARTAYKPRLVVSHSALTTTATTASSNSGSEEKVVYDAYYQRPAVQGLPAPRGEAYWANAEHRATLDAHAAQRRLAFERECLLEGAVDTSEVEYSLNRVRKETLLYFRAHPINEMIQERYVRIRQIMPGDGSPTIYFDAELKPVDAPQQQLTRSTADERPKADDNKTHSNEDDDNTALTAGNKEDARSVKDMNDDDDDEAAASTQALALQQLRMDVDVPVQAARRMAQRLGLDLIRIGSIHTEKTDRRVIALCLLGDHREHMRDMLRFKMGKLGVQPPPTRECIEVGFRGGIHPHGIRFKSVGIAKHLLRRHAIRINLTKFGTPREAFPVLQTILDEIKLQCVRLKAYHKAGQIMANYDEVYCYLYPSTGKSPKTSVEHPSAEEVRAACEYCIAANEKEIYFDDLHGQLSARDHLRYLTKLEQGTAWADKDAGPSLQRQRAMKIMLGYLPKGNKELYAARGDVDVPAPFRARHPTTIDAWDYPRESNLEQASRGAATLGKRAAMNITEMHDRDETPDNPTTLDHFYYRVKGAALEVGEMKEALGLKNNRRRRIPLGQGFATLGMAHGGTSAPPPPHAAK